MRPRAAASVLLASARAQLTLWHGQLDRHPAYLSSANVSLSVQQDGDFRNFVWEAGWLGGSLVGEMNMGRMTCRLTEAERRDLAGLSPEERGNTTLPCAFRDAEELAAGTDIVRRIAASVAALGARRVAMVGLGPGTMATYWQRYHPQIERIDVVELSGAVLDVARRYFGLRTDDRLRVHTMDGVDWLQHAGRFDVFVHDATGSQHIFLRPSVLKLIEQRTNGGAMVMNACGVGAMIWAMTLAYLRCHFHEVRTNGDVIVASWGPVAWTWDGLPEHTRAWQDPDGWTVYSGLGIRHAAALAIMATAVVLLVVAARRIRRADRGCFEVDVDAKLARGRVAMLRSRRSAALRRADLSV